MASNILVRGIALLALLASSTAASGDGGPRSFGEVKREQERATEAFQKRWEAIKTEADRATLLAEHWDEIRDAARKALDWAEAHPNGPEAIDAMYLITESLRRRSMIGAAFITVTHCVTSEIAA